MLGNLLLFYRQVLQHYRFTTALLIGLTAFAGLLEGVALLCLMPLLNNGLMSASYHSSFFELFHRAWNPVDKTKMLAVSLGSFFVLGLLLAAVKLYADVGVLKLRTTIEFSSRSQLTSALLSMQWYHFVTLKIGEIAKSMSQEGYMIGLGVEAFVQLCGQSLVCVCLLTLAFGLSPKMTAITLLFGFFVWLVSRVLSSGTETHAKSLAAVSSSLSNVTDECFSNLKFVKSFGLTPYMARRLSAEQKNCAHHFYKTYLFNPLGRFSFEALGIVFISFIVAFAFWVTPFAFGRIIVFLAVFYRLAPRLMNLQIGYNQVLSIKPWYASWKERYAYALGHQEPSSHQKMIEPNSFEELRFDHVHFRYDDRSILKDISFRITRGQMLALVGESGGGKTTLLDMVTGLIFPTEGACSLNGISTQDLAWDFWRSKIGVVMQSSPIFHTTVLQNIVMSDASPDVAKAERCARMAHAWEFIERLPGMLDCDLGEKGGDLSQGECQRLALARALYRDPWLLILDEATSALDAQSESYILETLRRIKGAVTILMVSHRLNTVDFADEILLLDHSEILERGSYADLIHRPSSRFRTMAKLQGLVD